MIIKRDRHRSPDGLLTLLVVHGEDDITVGFEGSSAHTHGDILTHRYGGSPSDAAAAFIEDVLQDRAVIAVLSYDSGEKSEAWVSEDPAAEHRHLEAGENLDLRYWSGKPWTSPSVR